MALAGMKMITQCGMDGHLPLISPHRSLTYPRIQHAFQATDPRANGGDGAWASAVAAAASEGSGAVLTEAQVGQGWKRLALELMGDPSEPRTNSTLIKQLRFESP